MGKVTNNFPKKTYFCLINLYAMKITIVSGARPNFMKIAPITRAIKAAQEAGKKISYRLIYTGRQDDTSLDASLFSDLDMKRPDGYLGVTGHDHSEVAAAIMLAFEKELNNHPAQVVLVVDDLTATMSCSIVAKKRGYLLLTLNRHDLLTKKHVLKSLIQTLIEKSEGMPIIAPLHPYVQKAIKSLDIPASNLHILPPQSYLHFGYLINHAKGIVTDSGNIAEEATFLDVPCITLNSYAEHPETWRVGTNELVNEDSVALANALERLMLGEWKHTTLPDRWDGRTAERIVQTLINGELKEHY